MYNMYMYCKDAFLVAAEQFVFSICLPSVSLSLFRYYFCSIYVHITQSIEEKSNTNEKQTGQFNCHLRGLDLENIEKGILGLGAIDPYFELSKKYTDHDNGITRWVPVYRSEHRPNIIVSYSVCVYK